MKTFKYIFAVLVLSSSIAMAQQTPAPKQSEAITIVGATAHIGNGEVIENALIIIEDGKITVCTDARKRIFKRNRNP